VKGQNPGDIHAAQEQFLGAGMTVDGTGALCADQMARDCDARSSRPCASMVASVTVSAKINTSARSACAEVFT
jgi:hypothetical protein